MLLTGEIYGIININVIYEEILSIAKSRDMIGFCNTLINEFVWNTRFYQ